DVRLTKKAKIIERAKALLQTLMEGSKVSGASLTETVRQSVQVQEIISYGKEKCPAGPNIETSDAIIIVEGRSDVLNLLKYGIKNAIAVEGTNVPQTIQELSKERIVTAFVDGDRGGELILRELLQTCEIDFIARAPRGREVEELTQKQVMKALRNKVPAEQFIEMFGLNKEGGGQIQDTMSLFEDNEDDEADQKQDKRPVMPKPKIEKQERPQAPQPQIEKPIAQQAEKNHEQKIESKEKQLSPEQQKYKRILNGLAGSFKAQLINSKGITVKEIAVKDLIETLRSPPHDITAIVFDGVISQRLLDLAVENKIKTVVGVKCGSITKQPTSVEVITKTDLE
ncbi:MAG: DNA primase DnaG, partial [Thermoplasmata archaeon]